MPSTKRRFMVSILILLFCIYQTQSSASLVDFNFQILKMKSLPDTTTPYTIEVTRGFISCSILCVRSAQCRAVFASGDSMSGSHSCSLLDQRIPDDQLDPGTGMYIKPEALVPTEDPSSFPGGTFRKTIIYNDMHVAVFDFPETNLKTLRVIFDARKGQWPTLSFQCADRLRYVTGFTSTVVSIVEEDPGTSFRLKAHCQEDETNWGDAFCSSNQDWVVNAGDVGVACVSTICYRLNKSGHARYSGRVNKTRDGNDCWLWVNTQQEGDPLFPEDGYSRENAANFCQDPAGIGTTFCRHPPSNERCDVPLCENSHLEIE